MKMLPFVFGIISIVVFLGFIVLGIRDTRERFPEDRVLVLTPSNTSTTEAELSTSSQIQLDDEVQEAKILASQPLLPDDRPDWVAQADRVDGAIHRIAIATELSSSIEDCRAKLDEALVDGMHRYVDDHLAKNQKVASMLAELNAGWIRAHLMNSTLEYDAEIKRPADTYHQLWVQLEIGPQERSTIEKWIQQLETTRRAGAVGLTAGGLVVCLAVLNAGLKLFSKVK